MIFLAWLENLHPLSARVRVRWKPSQISSLKSSTEVNELSRMKKKSTGKWYPQKAKRRKMKGRCAESAGAQTSVTTLHQKIANNPIKQHYMQLFSIHNFLPFLAPFRHDWNRRSCCDSIQWDKRKDTERTWPTSLKRRTS